VKLLIDVNVLLDAALVRSPWDQAAVQLIGAVENGKAEGWMAGHTLPTAYYFVAKEHGKPTASSMAAGVLRVLDVVTAGRADLQRALGLQFRDFEDAVQAVCADRAGADYIVTRDLAGFRDSPVPAREPRRCCSC